MILIQRVEGGGGRNQPFLKRKRLKKGKGVKGGQSNSITYIMHYTIHYTVQYTPNLINKI